MKYFNPVTERQEDTASEPIRHLIGIAYGLRKGAFRFTTMNGPTAITEFVRGLRARIFRDHHPLDPALRAVLNTLDAPACRCGKAGTRIIGGTTFCQSCGPNEATRDRRAWMNRFNEIKSQVIQHARRTKDETDLKKPFIKRRHAKP